MNTVLSLLVLAAIAMIGGAYFLWRKVGATQQVWLMLILAVVMIVNVLIWTLPDETGTAPVDRAGEVE
ncbi:drug/metabolite transporter superfamily protein YnfA [Altererythrobacter atlanticus]|uniref:Uncharacterized protein n=1 Tax=Croceibacterium atlanticum TaxID=1267766 RepID=A0A0F7KR33_9SPHN|nr:hypothetical protein [Croceibacterium atlanticum]AKH42039.1 hypothetical protein WYH_00991 [Croceibacterium atlanticum]MBB5733393.1 drug/metabolite transporter superfamily protein YnfA [Croceibacterium atlanticum]